MVSMVRVRPSYAAAHGCEAGVAKSSDRSHMRVSLTLASQNSITSHDVGGPGDSFATFAQGKSDSGTGVPDFAKASKIATGASKAATGFSARSPPGSSGAMPAAPASN